MLCHIVKGGLNLFCHLKINLKQGTGNTIVKMNGDQLTKSRLRINNVLSSCIYVPSHLELFPQFRFVFLCGQISPNQAQ